MASSHTSREKSPSSLPAIQPRRNVIDENAYCLAVLHLPSPSHEIDLDDALKREAQNMGLSLPDEVTVIAATMSATTIASDFHKQESIVSQSTAPTSCSSSEYRSVPNTLASQTPSDAPTLLPSASSEAEKRRSSSFRDGIRRMAGFKKRRSLGLKPSTLSSISDSVTTQESDRISVKSGMKSPTSIKSSKSSWSSPNSATKSSYEQADAVDHDAVKRSKESTEIRELRDRQVDEKTRFLEFQRNLVEQLRQERDASKNQKRMEHDSIREQRRVKADKAIEDMEARQLEEELKVQNELELEKRAIMTRLRHMEAYCRNPTPPPPPIDRPSGRASVDSPLPERRITDRDYHNLAQQYRERDAMDNLHASKINVLRGRQKRATESLTRKKERELIQLEEEQQKELERVDKEFTAHEEDLGTALSYKQTKLESRWRVQALIERTKIERRTGLNYAALPDIVISNNAHDVLAAT